MPRWKIVVFAVAVVCAIAPGTSVTAHELGASALDVRVNAESVDLRLDLPVDALADALESELTSPLTESLDPFSLSGIRDVVLAEVVPGLVLSSGGDPWMITPGRLSSETIEGAVYLRLDMASAPPSAAVGAFTLDYSVLMDSGDHRVIVTVYDSTGGTAVTVIDNEHRRLAVDGVDVSVSAGDAVGSGTFVSLFREGYVHVLDGLDHVLFIAALLFAAPLVAVARQWRSRHRPRDVIVHVGLVTVAFTVGHSLSLIAATIGWVSLPARLVELLIAVSVGVAGAHLIRPLVRGGEVLIAGAFGLVHGLAFAGILDGFGADSLVPLLGFNLGVEAAQLTVVAATVPSLLLLNRSRVAPATRLVVAAVIVVISVVWAMDRIGLATAPISTIESAVVDHLWWGAMALAGLAIVGRLVGPVSAAEQGAQLDPPSAGA